MNEDYVLYPMNDEYVKNKNYNMHAITVANYNGYIEENEETGESYRVIPESEFIAALKAEIKLTKYKCRIVVDTFIELGIMERHGKDLWLNVVKSKFLKLYAPTVGYCMRNLSCENFKLYCIFMNMWNIHNAYGHKQNYFFSDSELLDKMGYSRSEANIKKLQGHLATLEKLGLIEYNHERVGKPGKHGTYRELYAAHQFSNVQVSALQQLHHNPEYSLTDADKKEFEIYNGNDLLEKVTERVLNGEN